MKLTITSATNYDKKKDGSPMVDNKGRTKYRSVIKTVEKGDEFLSGFVFKPLNKGDIIEAEVKPETYNGQTRLTFQLAPSAPTSAGVHMPEMIAELKNHTIFMKKMLEALEGIHMSISTHQTIEAMKKPVVPNTPMPFDTADEEIGENQMDSMPSLGEDDFGDPFGN